MLRVIYHRDPKLTYRPYAQKGGLNGNHNHLTKEGMHHTITEALGGLPEMQWIDPDVLPENLHLRDMCLRQPWQTQCVAEVLRHQYFKPLLARPCEEFESTWLGADQINDLMLQKTCMKRSFGFLGVFAPTEKQTENMVDRLRKMKKVRYLKPYKYYGVILNTSSDQGMHWVSVLWMPFSKRYEYFDSLNEPPPIAIKTQVDVVNHAMASLYGFKVEEWKTPNGVTTQKHQQGTTQCGMYCIWFILQRVMHRKSFRSLHETPVLDEEMMYQRELHFRRQSY
jgi:hypothetical protein